MMLDYFVAGPRLALRSTLAMGPVTPQRLDFAVCDPEGGEIALARTELVGPFVQTVMMWARPPRDEGVIGEAMSLVARVLRRLTPVELRFVPGVVLSDDPDGLRSDGFRRISADEWYMPPDGPTQRREKAPGIEKAYADPYDIVWNFEPRPWPFLTDCIMDLAKFPGARVLDLGCGFGKNAILLEGLGFETHGVDSAASAIDVCRRWVRHPERFQVASVADLPAADDSFQAVVDVGCLHCLTDHDLQSAIDEIARVLVPSGRLFARVFLPRDPRWLDAQAYRIDRVGLEPDEIVRLLQPRFDVGIQPRPELQLNIVSAVLRA